MGMHINKSWRHHTTSRIDALTNLDLIIHDHCVQIIDKNYFAITNKHISRDWSSAQAIEYVAVLDHRIELQNLLRLLLAASRQKHTNCEQAGYSCHDGLHGMSVKKGQRNNTTSYYFSDPLA
jgi:hypothetical protein